MTRGKTRITGIILLLILAISYVSNEYSKYDKFLGEKFPDNFSFNLGRYLLQYTDDFEIESFDNKVELEKLDIWLQDNYKFSEYESDLLGYGYSIKDVPSKNLYFFCLNGPDGKMSDKNISRIKGLELDNGHYPNKCVS